MAALIPSASATGSGTMTLAGPSTNSNQTVTIPDATGTMMVSGNMPTFSYYQSSNQSISNATVTKLTFTTSEWDTTSGMYASSRFTPTIAGYYQINANVYMSSATTVIAFINKSGTLIKQGQQSATNQATGVSSIVYCNGSTDYIEIHVYQGVGIAQNTDSSQAHTWFNGCLLRAA
jgi:hypothetical protein